MGLYFHLQASTKFNQFVSITAFARKRIRPSSQNSCQVQVTEVSKGSH